MADRQKLLAWGVMALAGVWLTDQLYVSPWLAERRKLTTDIKATRDLVTAAEATLAHKAGVMARWKAIDERLGRARESDARNEFVAGMRVMAELVGLRDWQWKEGRETKTGARGEFTEYAIVTNFKAGWEPFVRLLWELRTWKDFVRVQHLAVTSKYERENRLDVELRLSTIEPAGK
jgi:hypothetical protein